MFGIDIERHPHLTLIMMPQTQEGHPLSKDYPALAPDLDHSALTKAKHYLEKDAPPCKREDFGIDHGTDNEDFMILNNGLNHAAAQAEFRMIPHLDGAEIFHLFPDPCYHPGGPLHMPERHVFHFHLPHPA
ncbi:NADH-quinone oxidoreductase subunit C, partial [Salmonella enterica]|uniref:NADH-quinone oxidoreductase subunit C n=1 Tax=Salmonella enterica TaxID=28901 RepID=UPI00398C546A